MPYCVNCGVELERSEKKCPLCGVEVINPLQPHDPAHERPYPERPDPVMTKANRHFIASIISILFAFPAFLCGAINLILDGNLSWSLYVAGALALAWVITVPYFLLNKRTLTSLFLPDTAALLGFLLLIALLRSGLNWYLTLAMPLAVLCCFFIYITGLLAGSGKVKGYKLPSLVFASVGIMLVGIELIINLYLGRGITFVWSFYVLIPCLAVSLIWLTISRRQSVREEINKRLHL